MIKKKKSILFVIFASIFSLLSIGSVSALNGYGTTRLALLNSRSKLPSDGNYNLIGYSGSGRYLYFYSKDGSLVAGDQTTSSNDFPDIFRQDTLSGSISIVNKNENNAQITNAPATLGNIPGKKLSSDDDRYLAFSQNGACYLRDMATDTTSVISAHVDAGPICENPSISGNGLWVAYTKHLGSTKQVYIYDAVNSTSILISKDSTANPGNNDSGLIAISDDGNYVFYTTNASNIDPQIPANNPYSSLILYKKADGTSSVLDSIRQAGCWVGDISAAGSRLLLQCVTNNGDGTYTSKLSYYDVSSNQITQVSNPLTTTTSTSQSNDQLSLQEISPDGNLVAIQYYANRAVNSQDTNNHSDGAIYNISSNTLTMSGTGSSGQLANNENSSPYGFTNDGSKYLFNSSATNLSSVTSSFSVNGYEHFNVDNAPAPTYDLTAPSTSKLTLSVNPKTVNQTSVVSMKASDSSGISKVEYFIGTDPGRGFAKSMVLNGTSYSSTLENTLTPGSYILKSRAMDTSGNWSALLSITLIVQ